MLLLSADFFQNQLFRKIISGIPTECQTVWIQIGPDILLGPICVQTVFQSLSADDTSRQKVNMQKLFLFSDAVKNIIQYLGMQPCERSDKVPDGKSSHSLYLAGVYRGGHDALVRAKLALTDSGVTMQLTVRSTDPSVSEVLVSAVG